ncbi:MAG: hypothetical protein HRT35_20555 [Algicola sp.]|nr:hypothetical protein [Algicola sp.]
MDKMLRRYEMLGTPQGESARCTERLYTLLFSGLTGCGIVTVKPCAA